MTRDARFEDGHEKPLHLKAFDTEDLQVIGALVQDAVLPMDQVEWNRKSRRLALLVNRFRWERGAQATPERVQSMLVIEDVRKVQSQGVDRGRSDTGTSILSLSFEPADDGQGRVMIVMAGDGAICADVEALEITLKDVTRPYIAPSGRRPDHGT